MHPRYEKEPRTTNLGGVRSEIDDAGHNPCAFTLFLGGWVPAGRPAALALFVTNPSTTFATFVRISDPNRPAARRSLRAVNDGVK